METSITTWLNKLNLSPLPPSMNFQAMHTRIFRTLFYPLPVTCFDKQQCRLLEISLYSKSLPKCGISSKAPLAMRYAPKKYFGFSFPSFYNHQGLFLCKELLSSFETHNTTDNLFLQFLELIHLTLGTSTWLFSIPLQPYRSLPEPTWMVLTWEFLSLSKLQIHAPHSHLLPSRENDSFIMEAFAYLNLGQTDFICLNRCRLYLQVITLSDITDAGGRTIPTMYMNGLFSSTRLSFYNWPNQGRPPETDWVKWRKYLRQSFLHPRTNRLRQPLGRWTRKPHQHWTWQYSPLMDCVYKQDGNVYHC